MDATSKFEPDFDSERVWSVAELNGRIKRLLEGEIEVKIEGKSQRPQIGKEVFIPANALHTLRNVGSIGNVWYYGYKSVK